MSTPTVKNSTPMTAVILLLIGTLLFIAIIILWATSPSETPSGNSNQSELTTLPDFFTRLDTLTQGKVVRINIPSGYECSYFGGGKKYYHQAQNCEPEIWGGGNCPTGLGNPNASYADIWYYDEIVIVKCEFKKK
jgi:hypothetical protein